MTTVNRRNEVLEFLKKLTELCGEYEIEILSEDSLALLYDNKEESYIGSFGTGFNDLIYKVYRWD